MAPKNAMKLYSGRVRVAQKPPFGSWWRISIDPSGSIDDYYGLETIYAQYSPRWDTLDREEWLFFMVDERRRQAVWFGTREEAAELRSLGIIGLNGEWNPGGTKSGTAATQGGCLIPMVGLLGVTVALAGIALS